jgi:hypothetical protein
MFQDSLRGSKASFFDNLLSNAYTKQATLAALITPICRMGTDALA